MEDDGFCATLEADPGKLWTPEEILSEAMKKTVYFEPGMGWHYSNTGCNSKILGRLYGYGLALTRCERQPLGQLEGHGGAIWGFRAQPFYGSEHDAFVSIVINGEDSPAIDDIAGGVLEAILPQ